MDGVVGSSAGMNAAGLMTQKPIIKPLLNIAKFIISLLLLNSTVYATGGDNSDNVAAGKRQLKREDSLITKEKQCTFVMNQMAAAMAADDWTQLDRISRGYLKQCKEIATPERLSSAYENIAFANNQLKNYKQALMAANTCISVYYANPGCHILKAEALFAVKRYDEAIRVLETAEKLTRHALDNARRERERSILDLDKELYDAQIHLYESQLDRIERMWWLTY